MLFGIIIPCILYEIQKVISRFVKYICIIINHRIKLTVNMKAIPINTNQSLNNKRAKLAGILYLSLAPLGILGIIYVPTSIIVPEDIGATISNITENETLFRWSIITMVILVVFDGCRLVDILEDYLRWILIRWCHDSVTTSYRGI